jgi:dTDP-4-dehydrorhamnose 3,5-epimerase
MSVPTTEVTAHETEIPGLIIFDVTKVEDERGYYQETYQKAKLVAAGMPEDFTVVQSSTSYNKNAGVTRGFHAEPWDKYLTVIKGRVFAAWVDLRDGESYGHVVSAEVAPGTAVFVPQGVGNSFQVLEDDTYYLYSVNAHWSADLYDDYCFANLADPEIGIEWPIPLDQAVMSDRDRNHPLLKDAKRFASRG